MGKKALVWDLSIRIFHWLFALCFALAMIIGSLFDDDGALFDFHGIFGLIMLFLVVLRVLYGFIGTKYARFQHFNFKLSDLFNYITLFASSDKKKYSGHNPASSYAIIFMFTLAVLIAVTGIFAAQDHEFAEDLHEIFANVMLFIVAVHIVGVFVYSIVYKENLTMSMLDGKKIIDTNDTPIKSKQTLVATVFVIIVALWSFTLVGSYDSNRGTVEVPLMGVTLDLREDDD